MKTFLAIFIILAAAGVLWLAIRTYDPDAAIRLKPEDWNLKLPPGSSLHRDAEYHELDIQTGEDTYYVFDTFTR